jgi:hypothetical protein
MSNVLDDDTQQQVRALGRLGWTLVRITACIKQHVTPASTIYTDGL